MSTTTQDQLAQFETDATTFGGRLQAARQAKGLTVAGLGEKLGVEAGRVEVWESGTEAPLPHRISIMAGMLNVSIIWLITGESNGTTHIVEAHARPTIINDTLGEIAQLKTTLLDAHAKLESLEERLREAN